MKDEKACQTCKHKMACLQLQRMKQGVRCTTDKLEKWEKEEK